VSSPATKTLPSVQDPDPNDLDRSKLREPSRLNAPTSESGRAAPSADRMSIKGPIKTQSRCSHGRPLTGNAITSPAIRARLHVAIGGTLRNAAALCTSGVLTMARSGTPVASGWKFAALMPRK
jgi:hypothetical protein